MATTRILLVEDDEDDYVIARDVLEEISFLDIELIRAANVSAAYDYLKQNNFDLCLLDYQLGAFNGIEVLKHARASGFSAPIIMLTGQADSKLDEQALDAGAADYLNKSEIGTGRFIRSIRYALARRDVERERVERLKAEAENESKNRFLAHLSHELRTPLTSILGYTELLLNSDKGAQAAVELDVIYRNGKHLLNLLNDVLDLSKIAADRLEINTSKVDVGSLIVDVYTLLRVNAIDKGLNITLASTTPIPTIITSDSTRLRQIIINVVSNAIKFTDEGEINIALSMDDHAGKEKLCVVVKDTGIGIPADKLEEIFSPFSQVADVISKSVGGSGLGLAISSTLAKMLGGEIVVESKIGEGSRFSIYIDVGDVSNVGREWLRFDKQASTAPKKLEYSLEGKVLVVDDLRDIRSLVGHIISQVGVKAEYAANGARAIAVIESAQQAGKPFDLVLMDIHMPEMDGKQAVTLLRNKGYSLPIVALTAASMRGSYEQLEICGFNGMLSKPVDIDKLFQVLNSYLIRKENAKPPHVSLVAESPAAMPSKSSTELSILLVEDDPDAANAVAELMGHLGAQVSVVNSVKHGCEQLQAKKWDAVLVDKNLTDGSGFSVITKIGEQGVSTYVAVVSGDEISLAAHPELSINEVLLKPLQLSALKQLVANIRGYAGA
ncbi:response regulator [Saccharophagus degradans]|uniref:response regulator n=1 Tax=Saccharophagus degradans TaxID=86304 RepID=UPI001C08687F|nr:response regulator [Saccharophagus degradans]MBU2986937.1 response regulator [Saccharophagus degradans]